jgi:hypothetical protein
MNFQRFCGSDFMSARLVSVMHETLKRIGLPYDMAPSVGLQDVPNVPSADGKLFAYGGDRRSGSVHVPSY